MASWTKHLDKNPHPTDSTRERSHFEREGVSLADYHAHLHDEYPEASSHSHTEHGQTIFKDRRNEQGRHNHRFNPNSAYGMKPEGQCPECDRMLGDIRAKQPDNPFEGLG